MRNSIALALLLCLGLAAANPLAAQQPRLSPHETISKVVDKNRVTIVYGRPYMKSPKTGEVRTVWGGTLVPPDAVWRLGSDEATLLITQKAIVLGGVSIPAGAYTLCLFEAANGSAKLIVNKALGQWGIPYTQESQELARIDLTKETLDASAEQFTMKLEAVKGGGGKLSLAWDTTQFSVPFTLAK
jgi:hypothetical protein